MVLPNPLLYRYREVFQSFPSTVSRLDQAITTKLLSEGYFERHLNRLRNRYKARHDALITALKQAGDKVRLSGINAGSYVVLEWEGEMSEEELLESANRQGIRLYPLSNYMITPCFRMYPTFLMGFAQMDTEELNGAITALYENWR
jgi:GntR family transcriptional regulator/MocR family aminotransferase